MRCDASALGRFARTLGDRIPGTTVVTDPKTVAESWGRTDY
jgi:hypothetical protein